MSGEEMSSNGFLRVQTEVENYFRCFYCILFKNSAKNTI